jgi:Glycosyltransferase sugar-binding region containing DXD motif
MAPGAGSRLPVAPEAIPRRLHQVWLGPRPVPDRWAARWRARHRHWTYRLWREADVEAILPDGLRPAWEHFLGKAIWHGAADVARVAILLREGGVYVDIDSEPVRSLDGAPFMRGTFFAGLELGTPEAPVRITNGVIGTTRDHPILIDYAERIAAAEVIEPPWRTVGGGFLTEAVLGHLAPGVWVLPIRTFYPEDKNGVSAPGNARIYARQYWATTHRLYPHVGDSWRTLQRRRRGDPIPPPIRVRFAEMLRSWGRRLRRLFRRVVPKPVRALARGVLRRALRRG